MMMSMLSVDISLGVLIACKVKNFKSTENLADFNSIKLKW